MPRQIITTANAPSSPLYSQGVKAGPHVLVSGIVGIDPGTGKLSGDTIRAQTKQALTNCRAILEAGGAGLDDGHQPAADTRRIWIMRVLIALPERQIDEPCKLAWPVAGRTVVRGEHLARHLEHPPWTVVKCPASPVHQRTLVPHTSQECVRHTPGQVGARTGVVHRSIIATSRADCTPSCVPRPASNRRSQGLAMLWPGHKGVPGVAPERERRPKARVPPRSRDAAATEATEAPRGSARALQGCGIRLRVWSG
jgi:enamine deaminase RidA (YjgF/YER057c/UK114 family)